MLSYKSQVLVLAVASALASACAPLITVGDISANGALSNNNVKADATAVVSGNSATVSGNTANAASTVGTGTAVVPATAVPSAAPTAAPGAAPTAPPVFNGGIVTTLAGSSTVAGATDGSGSTATFSDASAIVADPQGNFYVSNTTTSTIRKVNPDGKVSTFAGNGRRGLLDNGLALDIEFADPGALAFNSHGDLFVADRTNARIRKIAAKDNLVTTFAGGGMAPMTEGNGPNVFIFDPGAMCVDASDNLYVVSNKTRVLKITPDAQVSILFEGATSANVPDVVPLSAANMDIDGITCDKAGNFFIVEAANNVVRKVDMAKGLITLYAGLVPVSAKTNAKKAVLNHPQGVVVDPYGVVYVADYGNRLIQRITSDGKLTVVAGGAPDLSYGVASLVDGVGSAASFGGPVALTLTSTGSLGVLDQAFQGPTIHPTLVRVVK